MRMSRYMFSESFNPWMRAIEVFAKVVEQKASAASPRTPIPQAGTESG
jgi:hypothetical protein